MDVGLAQVAEGLTSPLTVVPVHDDSNRLFIVDQIGLIRILTPEGTLVPEPLLDLRAKIVRLQAGVRRAGSSGLALHLLYAEQRGVDPLATEAAGLHLPVRAPRPLCDHVGKP
jgi:hypothetical protein